MRAICHGTTARADVPALWRELVASEQRLLTYRRGQLALDEIYEAEDAAFHSPGDDPVHCSWCVRQAIGLALPIPLPAIRQRNIA